MSRLSGTFANRPESRNAIGAYYLATDTGVVYLSLITRWVVRPELDFSKFINFSSAATYSAFPDPGTCIGWVFEDEATSKLYEAFPDAWFEVTNLIEGLGESDSAGAKTGDIKPRISSAAISGWLYCNGTAYLQSLYPDLFTLLGSTYNEQSDHTAPSAGYFRLPDYRGMALIGLDDTRGKDADRVAGSFQAAGVGTHTHEINAYGAPADLTSATGAYPAGRSSNGGHLWGSASTAQSAEDAVAAATDATPKNRVDNYPVYWFIKT